MRKVPSVVLLGLTVPALTALPVVTPPIAEPEPVTPHVRAVPVDGVDPAALRSAAGAESKEVSAEAREEVLVPGARGVAPNRPAVLTAAEGTADFELLGVTWRAGTDADLTVVVRTHGEDGWTDWTALDPAPTPEKAEGRLRRAGTEPLWAGPSDGYQVRIDVRTGSLPDDIRVDLVDPGTSDADATVGRAAPASVASAAMSMPQIYSRADWGADESLRDGSPNYTSTIKAGFVHHTAGTNGYSAADVPRILRGIYAYHTKGNGWSDLGYNFLVDRFGRIWEGRYGGVDQPVLGAHTGGFNTNTFGVSAIGNFDKAGAPAAMTDAIARVLAWKLSLHHRNPLGKVTLTSSGGGTSRYPAGRDVTVDVISAHRNMGYTSCPGKNLYAQMATIRSKVPGYIGMSLVDPTLSTSSLPYGSPLTVSATHLVRPATMRWRLTVTNRLTQLMTRQLTGRGPVDAVWDGHTMTGQLAAPGAYDIRLESWYGRSHARDFVTEVSVVGPDGSGDPPAGAHVWFRATDNGSAADTSTVAYGPNDSLALAGDWDGDGVSTPGVVDVIDGVLRWRLTNNPEGGAPDLVFAYGPSTCAPVAGDWNGDRRTTPGLVCLSGGALRWRLSNVNGTSSPARDFLFGAAWDMAVVGDWNADGRDGVGAVRSSSSGLGWALRNPLSAGTPNIRFAYGCTCAAPVTGDWDGNGTTNIGVARPSHEDILWQLRKVTGPGAPTHQFLWREATDRVMAADWEGSGASTVGAVGED